MLIILYSGINMIYEINFYYNELIGFIMIYFLVAYAKKYMKNYMNSKFKNFIMLHITFYFIVFFIVFTDILGVKYEYYSDKMLYWCKIFNPIIILFAFSIFNLIHSKKQKENKIISYLSSLTLLVYIFSDNYFSRTYIRMKFFDKYYGINVLNLVCVEFIRVVLFGFGCAIIYNLVFQKITQKIGNKIYNLIKKIGNSSLNFIMNNFT
jgi:hypothetical protein